MKVRRLRRGRRRLGAASTSGSLDRSSTCGVSARVTACGARPGRGWEGTAWIGTPPTPRTTPMYHHNPMEPHTTIASWTDDGPTLYHLIGTGRRSRSTANPNAIRLGASAACARPDCAEDADGLGGRHRGLRPGAMGGALELVVAHLALDRPGEGPQPAFGEQHRQQFLDRAADGGGELLRGKRPAPRSPAGARPVGWR
jgi:hypothetical protein